MRTSKSSLVATVLLTAAVVFTGITPASAFWGGGARKTLRQADEAMQTGRRAESDGRVMDACDAYSLAHQLYYKLSSEEPDHEPGHVAKQDAECLQRLRTLFARASSDATPDSSPDDLIADPLPKPAKSVPAAPVARVKPAPAGYARPASATRSAVYEEEIPLAPEEFRLEAASAAKPVAKPVRPAPVQASFAPPSTVPNDSTVFTPPAAQEDAYASREPMPIGNNPLAWRDAKVSSSTPAATVQPAALSAISRPAPAPAVQPQTASSAFPRPAPAVQPQTALSSVSPRPAAASVAQPQTIPAVRSSTVSVPARTMPTRPAQAVSAQSSAAAKSQTVSPALAAYRPVPAPVQPAVSTQSIAAKVRKMIAENKSADALITMEGIIEEKGVETTVEDRLVFAHALVNCGNYDRAEKVLESVLNNDPENIPALTMISGVKFVQGYPMAALKHMNTIVSKHPRYADVYVNIAYTRFAMDPIVNRQEAINCYKVALQLGADRDPNLELELNIGVIR